MVIAVLALLAADATLETIRERVANDLARLPNYTCRETIERFAAAPGSDKLHRLDTLRLEVAFIGGRELYAWPGSKKFQERRIDEMVGGSIANGMFALHARNIFVKPGAEFVRRGADAAGVRFDFTMPRARSLYFLHDGTHHTVVAYRGSFWADAATSELLRLEIHVDEVPPPVQITRVFTSMDYGRVRLGDAAFLLPRAAETRTMTASGEAVNRTGFDGCKQYLGESVLSFEDAAPRSETKPAEATVSIPAGLSVEMNLRTPLDCSKTAIGDPVEAVLAGNLKSGGRLLLPKGAAFTGNVTRIERRRAGRFDYCVAGLEFADLTGELEDAGFSTNAAFHIPFRPAFGTRTVWTGMPHATAPPRPNEGVFYFRGPSLRTSPGLRLVWKTR